MLLTTLLWLCLLDASRADRIADNLAGFRNEYRVVLGAGLLAVILSFVAADPRSQVVVRRGAALARPARCLHPCAFSVVPESAGVLSAMACFRQLRSVTSSDSTLQTALSGETGESILREALDFPVCHRW